MKSTVNTPILERGILSSVYKQEIKNSIREMHSQSLSKIKNRIKKNRNMLCCEAGTFLKVSMFFITLVLIIF